MTTKVIGIKEFRNNITNVWKDVKKGEVRLIIMHHSTPIFEVTPIKEDRLTLEKFTNEIQEARKQVKKGEVYSEAQVYKELGL